MLIFGVLTVDRIEFQLLIIDYVHIYGSIQWESIVTPPLP